MAEMDSDKSESKNDEGPATSTSSIVRPPRKISRPKISLKMPTAMSQPLPTIYSATPGIRTIPLTPATGFPPNFATFPNLPTYPVHLFQAYPNKAQEFMFKQFRGFKDFTMNTGKIGLSFGEKSVFWAYGRIRQLSTNSFTHIMLFIVIMIYCVIGGFVFYILENGDESARMDSFKKEKDRKFKDTVNALLKLTRNDTFARLYVTGNVTNFVNFLQDNAGIFGKHASWDLSTSILFCGTVFTTIGYGHLAPTTHFGRIATIVYSLFGIPMFLILLADYGKLFTRSIKFVWAFVRRLYYTGSCRKVRRTAPVQEVMKGMQMMYGMTRRQSKDQATVVESSIADVQIPPGTASPTCTPALSSYTIDDQFNLPISVAFVILLVYMIAGAGFFSYTENWEFLDAFYFVYISMSTIGFGDLVPKSQMTTMMVTLVYFVFGLALTSMCINVIQEKLSNSFKQATAKIGATIGFEVENDAVVVQFENPEQQLQLDIVVPSNEQYEEQT